MITNPILAEKDRVQMALAEEAEYDVHKYSELIHRIVLDMEQQYGFKVNYVTRRNGVFVPMESPDTLDGPRME